MFMIWGFSPTLSVFWATVMTFAMSFLTRETALVPKKLVRALAKSRKVETVLLDGGSPPLSEPCQARSQHGFLGIEDQAVNGIAQFIKQELPFGRFGKPEEVSAAIAFLASPKASWISGTTVVVDGCQSRMF